MAEQVRSIKDGRIFLVGKSVPDLRIFDVIMQTKFGSSYNAYVLKGSSKTALIETIKVPFFDEYIEKVKSVVGDLSKIDYLVLDHTEPDHSGSVEKLLKLAPQITIVASRTALSYLKGITNNSFDHVKTIVAADGTSISLGDLTMNFISAPMLHWPDSIYTSVPEINTIFTCDSFGSHYAYAEGHHLVSEVPAEKNDNYLEALKYYYDCIFSPFKPFVLSAMKTLKERNVPFDLICPGHGPILDSRIEEVMNLYKEWSEDQPVRNPKKITIAYATAYGMTETGASAIMEGMKGVDPALELHYYNVDVNNYADLKPEIVANMQSSAGILLGSTTINQDALPPIWDLALSLNPIADRTRYMASFGSYGWSGEGPRNITQRLSQVCSNVFSPYVYRFKPSENELQGAKEFGRDFAKAMLSEARLPQLGKSGDTTAEDESLEAKWAKLNPNNEVVQWICDVCGAIFLGKRPPKICNVCGVGEEQFSLYKAQTIDFSNDRPLKVVIIGNGVSAVTAAEAARDRAPKAEITLVTDQKTPAYVRTMLSKNLDVSPTDPAFALHPESWYEEKNIRVLFDAPVESIDRKRKSITIAGNKNVFYDSLILANGCSPFIPPIKGSDGKGVFVVRRIEDALSINKWINEHHVKDAVVIGGGVLGLESAASLQRKGIKISIVEVAKNLFWNQLDPAGSALVEKELLQDGFALYKDVSTDEITASSDGAVSGVKISTGKTLPAQLVIINTGVRANVKMAETAGLKCERGLIVDEHMATEDSAIFGCGDVTNFNSAGPLYLWAPAIQQGKVAGANAVGDKSMTFTREAEPLWFQSLPNSFRVFSIGYNPKEEFDAGSNVQIFDEARGVYKRLLFKDSAVVGAILVGHFDKVQTLIERLRSDSEASYSGTIETLLAT